MRLLRVLCVLLGLGVAMLPTETPAQWPPWLFIIAGQSNARGAVVPIQSGPTSMLLVEAMGTDLQWYTASEDLLGPGPALPFAAAVRERAFAPMGLLQCAQGNTAIEQWAPSTDPATPYGACYRQIQAARQWGVFKGLLWDQGETDATADVRARPAEWAARFAAIAQQMRLDTQTPALPIVWAVIGPNAFDPASVPNWGTVQTQQRAVSLPLGTYTETTGLPLVDQVHYTRDGYQELGRRFAAAWWALPH